MASTYTVNLGIEKIGTGEQSGTWGTTTNTNFDLIDQAINGAVTVTLASAGTSGSPNTLAITDGTVSDGRNKFIDFADGGDLGAAAYIQLTPNDAEKLVHIRNSLSGGRSIFVFQGTYNASNDFEIPNGKDVVLKFDGGGATATVTQVFEDLLVTAVAATTVDTTNIEVTNLKAKDGTAAGSIADSTGVVTLASSVLTTTDINGGSVDGVTLGTNSAVTEAQIDNININGNTISSTDTNGNVTITPDGTGSVAITKIDVAGGEIDGTAIGANSASTAVFTDLTASGTVSFSGATVSDGGTVTTVNIDGGSIDNTIIGAATPAAGSFTTGQFGTSLNVDGTVTADGLTVDGNAKIKTGGPAVSLLVGVDLSNSDSGLYYEPTGRLHLRARGGYPLEFNTAATAGTNLNRMDIASNGDISFYEPTGTNARIVYDADTAFIVNEDSADFDFRVESDTDTHAFFVDAGNSRVGIGTSSPAYGLDVRNTIYSSVAAATKNLTLGDSTNSTISAISTNNSNLIFYADGSNESMRIDSAGSVGIGVTPSAWFAYDVAQIQYLGVYGSTGNGGVSYNAYFETPGQWKYIVNGPATAHDQFNGIHRFYYAGSGTAGANLTWVQQLQLSTTEAIVNEESNDYDFRVESDANTHMLFVDAGNSRVGIGESIPGDTLQLNGGNIVNPNSTGSEITSATFGVGGNIHLEERQPNGAFSDRTDLVIVTNTGFGVGESDKLRLAASGAITTYPVANAETVFNESGVDADFRVESDTNTHMLFVDAGNNRVGIGASSTTGMLTIGNDNATRAYSDRVRTEWNSIFAVTENTHYQRFKLTADSIRVSAYVKVTIQPHSSGGIADMNGATLEGSIWRADGGAQFALTLINNAAWGAGGVSLSEPVASGNDIIFGVVVGNNGTGTTYDVACKVELIGNTDGFFTYSEIAGTTAATGTNPGQGHFFYYNGSQLLGMDSGGTVVNEASGDRDFRVESDANTHALFVDAGNSRVGFFDTSAPLSTVEMVTGNGTVGDSGNLLSIKSGAGNLVDKLQLGVNSTSGYGFIQAIKPGTGTEPLLIQPNGGSVIINENGEANNDFRVESDNDTHMLFVDAGNDRVGIGTSSPSEALTVNGAVEITGDLSSGVRLIRRTYGNFELEYLVGTTLVSSGEAMQLTFTCGAIRRSAVIEITIAGSWTPSNIAGNHPAAKYIMRVLTNDSGVSSIDGPTAIYEYIFSSATHFTFTSLGSSQYRIDLANAIAQNNVNYTYNIKVINAAATGHTLTSAVVA